MALKTRIKGLGMKARSRFKRAKKAVGSAAGSFNFTSARKAALEKAQKASALARSKQGRKGLKMKATSRIKRAGAATAKAASAGAAKARAGAKEVKRRAPIAAAAASYKVSRKRGLVGGSGGTKRGRRTGNVSYGPSTRGSANKVMKPRKSAGNVRGAAVPSARKSRTTGGRGGARGNQNSRSRAFKSPTLERARNAFNRWNFNKRKNR